MALVDLERAVQRVCFEAEPPTAALSQLGDERVWLLYREMVRARLLREIRHALRRTCKAAGPALLERAFAHHLHAHPPRTRFFRGVVRAFVDSSLPLWRDDPSVPAFLPDLAEYEAALWDVADLDATPPASASEFAFDRSVLFSPAHRLLKLSHAVQKRRPSAEYPRVETHLLVHRPSDDAKPKTWVLTPVTYELFALLASGESSVGEAVRAAAARRAVVIDEPFLERLCAVLADFIESGFILGSR